MAARPILSAVSIILLAGGIVLQFFIVLSGAINTLPMNLVYFISASTDGISGSSPLPNPARWTYFSICSASNGHNSACGKVTAALPFDPRRNFGTRTNMPQQFLNNGSYYYYMSRVAWAFYIIALFFAVVALLLSVTALCSRLAAKLTGLMTLTAAVMQAVAAALMTYVSPIYLPSLLHALTSSQRVDRLCSPSLQVQRPECISRQIRLRIHLGRFRVLADLHRPLLCRREGRQE